VHLVATSRPVRKFDEFHWGAVGILYEEHPHPVDRERLLVGLVAGGGDAPVGSVEICHRQRNVLNPNDPKLAALEWGTDNMRVNVVCPLANSDGMRVFSEVAPKEYERVVRGVPLRRIGDTREDIGAVVAFLFCDDASYLTGQTLLLDGGSGSFR
jgi:Enoyl-(Acyl carrier protein) reductase